MLPQGESVLTREWALESFDPWDPRLNRSNIWDLYRAVRCRGPVVYSAAHGGFWLISRYADVRRVALDHRGFSSRLGVSIGKQPKEPPSTPLERDPPEHARFRSVMLEPFKPRRLGHFEMAVRAHVAELLEGLRKRRHVDIVTDIAEELTFRVISDVIGFGPQARERNRRLSLAAVNASYADSGDADRRYVEFLGEEVDLRLRVPTPGLLGDLARMGGAGRPFSRDELVSMARALGLAGFHSTVNGIASALRMAADPDLRARDLADPPAGIGAFVEEVLRIDPPIHLEGRRTPGPVTIGDVELPAGAQVALLFASGNHDDAEFTDPETFLPGRKSPHLSFGHGIHTCLGMALSRLEMTLAVEGVLARFPAFALDGDPVDSGMRYGHHMGWSAIPARLW